MGVCVVNNAWCNSPEGRAVRRTAIGIWEMMSGEPEKIVDKFYDLVKWMIPRINQFDRAYKFTLGDRMTSLLLDTLQLIIKAMYTKNKLGMLYEINLNLEQLRYLVRLCRDFDLFGLKRYKYASEAINVVGSMVGGWTKQQRRK